MQYIERAQLAVVPLDNAVDSISVDKLRRILGIFPANIIYFELHGRIFGIISTGDICRESKMGSEMVRINREFRYLYEGEDIGRNRQSMPVLTKDHILAGEYTKWDYPTHLECESKSGLSVKQQMEGKKIVLVKPCNTFKERYEIFYKFSNYLKMQGIHFECIERDEIVEFVQDTDLILFVEGNERQAASAALNIIYGGKFFEEAKLKTYKDIEDGVLILQNLLEKTCMEQENAGGDDIVLFWMPSYAYFAESVLPLIIYYLKKGKKCRIVLPMTKIASQGVTNVKGMSAIIRRIVSMGGECCDTGCESIYKDKYNLCYLCSEYSQYIPHECRKNIKYVIALQTTAIYTHMYRIGGRFDEIFSDDQMSKIDFLIVSDYMADWICARNERWKSKICRFGYPKLDALYNAMTGDYDIPGEWKEKTKGKKTIFLPSIDGTILRIIDMIKKARMAVILRPHPIAMETHKDYIDDARNRYPDIIIDDMLDYYAAFKLSDAFIADSIDSVAVNYLYTGKPVCLYKADDVIIDLNEEAWYKSAYTVYDEEKLAAFLEMIKRGEDTERQRMEEFRRKVVVNFDGKVCDRIFEYFDRKLC